MKTLLVLSALVSLAIAAPALPEEGLGDTHRIQNYHIQAQSSLPDSVKREKKSPSDITSSVSNTEVQNLHHLDSGSSALMGRSFGSKTPLIVQKKYGYRLYRDSEEEKAHADSHETCGRQVRVKLCDEDGKLRQTIKGSALDGTNTHMSEEDVKHSITMAKQAVENLQRDFKKIEHNTAMKMAHESESDSNLHNDIEIARKALEHIHENFGNLESMSLHTATRNSEDTHNVHLTKEKTEEERYAQWKEAKENILKNVEIAKNIEDKFKAASHLESLSHLESADTKIEDKLEQQTSSNAKLTHTSNVRAMENTDVEMHHVEKKGNEDKFLDKPTNEGLMEHTAREEQNTEVDMKTSPSTIIETHLNDFKNLELLRSENHESQKQETKAIEQLGKHHSHIENLENKFDHHHHNQEKTSEINIDMLTDQTEHQISQLPSIKAVEEEKKTKLDTESNTLFKTSENIPDAHISHTTSTDNIKPLSSDSLQLSEHQKSMEQRETEDEMEHQMEHKKSAWETTEDMIDFLAKSADHLDHDKEEKQNIHEEINLKHGLAKTAEKPDEEAKQEEHFSGHWDMKMNEAVHNPLRESEPEQTFDHIIKSAEHTNLNNIVEKNEHSMLAKSADDIPLQDHQKLHMIDYNVTDGFHAESLPAAKEAEEHMHHHMHKSHMHKSHLNNENRHFDESKKDFHMTHGHRHGINMEHTMDHFGNSHLTEHSQIPNDMLAAHNFDLSGHAQPHSHQHSARFHNSMTHSQMHDIGDMGAMHSNFHPSMRDAMEGLESEHMFRWKPLLHESPRVAYGSGLSSSIGSTGAVGVFPNANTGGCGIPLLLSCSPSVVSGSLAKTHSAGPASYNAPAYRTEDDFGFHNKRDIKQTNDIRTTNMLRTPTIAKQKNSILLENKM